MKLLKLMQSDTSSRDEAFKPLSSDLFERMKKLRDLGEKAKQARLLEG